ncbi:hypothetical protein KUTeg_020078 [Tegillarca granosa]|uniref:Uncharacterized protein n=1 Tax=Tegillarca granosa TaxID=220873 RepID=A0ABQ9EB96_TEGGR|nr:hypothetical protein KUTeg_020078 [Tegillarca granosa]
MIYTSQYYHRKDVDLPFLIAVDRYLKTLEEYKESEIRELDDKKQEIDRKQKMDRKQEDFISTTISMVCLL